MYNYSRKVWYLCCKYVLILLPYKPFIEIVRLLQYGRHGFKFYPLNWSNPQTFNERLNILKMSDPTELATIVADKVAVRDYVKNKVGGDLLIPCIGVFDSADTIVFNAYRSNL